MTLDNCHYFTYLQFRFLSDSTWIKIGTSSSFPSGKVKRKRMISDPNELSNYFSSDVPERGYPICEQSSGLEVVINISALPFGRSFGLVSFPQVTSRSFPLFSGQQLLPAPVVDCAALL